jgi:hypothetical protein
VRIRAPEGARIALAVESNVVAGHTNVVAGLPTALHGAGSGDPRTTEGDPRTTGYAAAEFNQVLVGMRIGPVYRLKVTEILNYPGIEIFPTVEVIDRLYPPPEMAQRYPIPVELTQDELELAANGSFVTRVIYVEDPRQALPTAQRRDSDQPWFEAPHGEDPLVTADQFGRPVAILRIGGRVPSASSVAVGSTPCDVPPLMMYDAALDYPRDCPEIVSDEAIGPLPRSPESGSTSAGR